MTKGARAGGKGVPRMRRHCTVRVVVGEYEEERGGGNVALRVHTLPPAVICVPLGKREVAARVPPLPAPATRAAGRERVRLR